MITIPLSRRRASRLVVTMATVAAFVGMAMASASAQGPAQPRDPAPAAAPRTASDDAALLAANVARLTAASAPKPAALGAPKPFAAWSLSAHALRDSLLVSVARTAIGTRYVRGGQSFEGGFDCSGLVRYIMTALKVSVPRTAAQQAVTGLALERDTTRLRPGDLLTFGRTPRSVTHVGIYLGNGRFVHASSVAGQVIESRIDRPWSPLIKPWRGSRRVLSDADADSTTARGGS
jgi:cell wall-associated NlpC family hydrolase